MKWKFCVVFRRLTPAHIYTGWMGKNKKQIHTAKERWNERRNKKKKFFYSKPSQIYTAISEEMKYIWSIKLHKVLSFYFSVLFFRGVVFPSIFIFFLSFQLYNKQCQRRREKKIVLQRAIWFPFLFLSSSL